MLFSLSGRVHCSKERIEGVKKLGWSLLEVLALIEIGFLTQLMHPWTPHIMSTWEIFDLTLVIIEVEQQLLQ